jgi:hypothetical protein
MMLGRIVPGRLPSTVADIKLIDQRIAFNRQQLALLPQRVAQGLLSQQDAAYRRLYLEGEIEQLTQAKRNRRYATPSYRTPLDVFESTRRGAPANKYVSESNNDGLPAGYFGDDNGSNGGSIPSDWNASDPADFDVPNVPSQAGFNVGNWPAHWPGSHSALITKAVMEAGEVGMKQVVDPRQDDTMKLKGLNLVNVPAHMATAKQIQANYAYLLEIVSASPAFTVTDRSLVNRIYGKINRQISDAEAAIEQAKAQGTYREFSNTQYSEEKIEDYKTYAIMKVTISWMDGSQSDLLRYYGASSKHGYIPKAENGMVPSKPEDIAAKYYKTSNEVRLEVDKFMQEQANLRELLYTHKGYSLYKAEEANPNYNDGRTREKYSIIGSDKVVYLEFTIDPSAKDSQGRYQSLELYYPKSTVTGYIDQQVSSGTWPTQSAIAGFFAGFKRNSRNARRTGNLMGLGAMQAHDRNAQLANDGGMSPYERKSYLQAEREMSLAKKRAGAKVDLTKQLREEPITRPWQMQVSLSTAALNAISTRLNQQLASMNLSQEMFTQQMHTNVAAVINSMPSGMAPSEQAEMIIEHVMAKATNSSGLLKKDVKVDINRGSTSPLTFNQAESLSGVVGSLSGTRAALGRLLR